MPHGSNHSAGPGDLRSRLQRLRACRSHRSGPLHSHESGASSRSNMSTASASPSRAVVTAAPSSIASWSPSRVRYRPGDRSGSHAGEWVNPGHTDDQSDRADQAGQPPRRPQYHWHQDTHHHHYYFQGASPQRQLPHQAAFALPTVPQVVAQPRLAHAVGCLVVFLVLLGAFLTFLVMLMGLALAGQILMLR